jgi:hypothetical protein
MPSFSISIHNPIPYPLQIESLQMWAEWLIEYSHPPSWMLNVVDESLGLERAIDMCWLALLLPRLTTQDPNTPTWMGNLKHLGQIYKTGIDLLSPTIIREMDVGDLKGLFPSAHNTEIARDLILTYKAYIELRKTHGHPAHDLRHSNWLERWHSKWTHGLHQEAHLPIHMYDMIPSIQQVALRAHQSLEASEFDIIITPTAVQSLWSSGVLDPATDIVLEEDEPVKSDVELADTIVGAGKWSIHRLHEMTGLPKSEIVLRLHHFFEQTGNSTESPLRPWLWGHTPRIITQPK